MVSVYCFGFCLASWFVGAIADTLLLTILWSLVWSTTPCHLPPKPVKPRSSLFHPECATIATGVSASSDVRPDPAT